MSSGKRPQSLETDLQNNVASTKRVYHVIFSDPNKIFIEVPKTKKGGKCSWGNIHGCI